MLLPWLSAVSFSFLHPRQVCLLPSLKMNTSSEATKVNLILDWTWICGVDTVSHKNIFIPMSASLLTYFLSHPFSLRKRREKKSNENIYGYVMTHLVFAPKKFSHHLPKFWIDKVRTSYTKIILFFCSLKFPSKAFFITIRIWIRRV